MIAAKEAEPGAGHGHGGKPSLLARAMWLRDFTIASARFIHRERMWAHNGYAKHLGGRMAAHLEPKLWRRRRAGGSDKDIVAPQSKDSWTWTRGGKVSLLGCAGGGTDLDDPGPTIDKLDARPSGAAGP